MSSSTTSTTATTIEISFPSQDKSFNLYGDLTLPSTASEKTPVPALLIVSGSGPIDRHGNVSGFFTGITFNTHNQFAQQLLLFFEQNNSNNNSKRSVAVLAYDKRGVGKSQKEQDKDLYYQAGVQDLVSDAVQAVKYLVHHPSIDEGSIFVVGHSEGAILMPLIFQQVQQQHEELPSPLKGCIFLAGLGEDVVSAMDCQRQRLLEEVNAETGWKGWILRQVLTKQRLDKQYQNMYDEVDKHPDLDVISQYCGMSKIPAKWFREHQQYQTPPWDAITCHCLAITGCKDLQVRSKFCQLEASRSLLSGAASVESHTPLNLTHILRSFEGEPKLLALKSDYARMGTLPLDDELVNIIGMWCDRILAC
mmetsp:Transcript_15653/g.23119  ORF Transcript_15653/g.23119 Transcript_15653/m.23119 type:complete len:364 (+) Transcript_15653:147-1238(+)